MRKYLALAAIAALSAALSASPALAGWSVNTNEADPFTPGTSKFIAVENGDQSALSIRCLEGQVSLLLIVPGSGGAAGDRGFIKIVTNSKSQVDASDEVLYATVLGAGIQFGDASILVYLKGAQKVSLRYELGNSISSLSFAGGRSLDGVIDKALKACGMSPPSEPGALAEPQASTPGKDCSGIPMENRTLDCAPSAQPISTTAQPGSAEWARASNACPRPNNFVADENDKWTCVKE